MTLFENDLLIFGASVRAAAFSALRAGFRPWCVDLFADEDLRARTSARRITERYPEGFAEFIEIDRPGPWMYTGALENRPRLIDQLARRRTLWGCAGKTLTTVRSPFALADLLRDAGHPGPLVRAVGEGPADRDGRRWLVKPTAGAGGAGIRFVGESTSVDPHCHLQEYLEGESRSALFAADGRNARFLGLTRQLVGCDWLHAAPFHYCGSVGPVPVTSQEWDRLQRLGDVLVGCGLRGLFGVDGVWRDGVLWPVEVNPRYPASAEVLEYAFGLPALKWHAWGAGGGPEPAATKPATEMVAKAVLFAPRDTSFPADGPWAADAAGVTPVTQMPAFADVPAVGETLHAGKPVLTFFARGRSAADCEKSLRETAAGLDARLFGC